MRLMTSYKNPLTKIEIEPLKKDMGYLFKGSYEKNGKNRHFGIKFETGASVVHFIENLRDLANGLEKDLND